MFGAALFSNLLVAQTNFGYNYQVWCAIPTGDPPDQNVGCR
ncbi:MAG: hypothetical protein R2818_15970 [Flavobacteriales bacterium]